MKNMLSLRSYTLRMCAHQHDYHQIVLPLNGHINIEVMGYKGKVMVGEAIVIQAGQRHAFNAQEEARFIVADIDTLPDNMCLMPHSKFVIDSPLLAFVQFVEKLLQSTMHTQLEKHLLAMFLELLKQQSLSTNKVDKRIAKALAVIHQQLDKKLSLEALAAVACLGQTQFKKLFQAGLGMSLRQYLIKVRMEKARSLLTYTDLPITLIAEQVGYEDLSAFSRRFNLYYGQAPRLFSAKI